MTSPMEAAIKELDNERKNAWVDVEMWKWLRDVLVSALSAERSRDEEIERRLAELEAWHDSGNEPEAKPTPCKHTGQHEKSTTVKCVDCGEILSQYDITSDSEPTLTKNGCEEFPCMMTDCPICYPKPTPLKLCGIHKEYHPGCKMCEPTPVIIA